MNPIIILQPEEVFIPEHRQRHGVNKATVQKLAESISQIGLQMPITVKRIKSRHELLTGLHRLEACKLLDASTIEAVEFDGDENDAKRWEISENLHRAELTRLERSEHIAEWVRLTEEKQKESVSAQIEPKLSARGRQREGRPESGTKAAARELGIERNEAQRSVKIDSISPEAKDIARKAGFDDHQQKLLKVARAPTEKQAEVARQIATPSTSTPPPTPSAPKVVHLSQALKDLLEAWDVASSTDREQFIRMRIHKKAA